MATLRNKRKLAAVTREIQDENPRNGQSRNTSVPRINEDYLTQLSEEIEGRITKKLSREFSRIESRISDALPKLDEVLSNQQIQTHSKTIPGTFRNTNVENQGTNEDDSQSDPHPEGGLFRSQTTQNSGPEAGHYSHFCYFVRIQTHKSLKQSRSTHLARTLSLNLYFVQLDFFIKNYCCVIHHSFLHLFGGSNRSITARLVRHQTLRGGKSADYVCIQFQI